MLHPPGTAIAAIGTEIVIITGLRRVEMWKICTDVVEDTMTLTIRTVVVSLHLLREVAMVIPTTKTTPAVAEEGALLVELADGEMLLVGPVLPGCEVRPRKALDRSATVSAKTQSGGLQPKASKVFLPCKQSLRACSASLVNRGRLVSQAL